ncbi:hypothetical protein DFQ26_005620 [Actinomortierella ambigua]|nr:hypothetical protein DFQ26_005620 [Actinomortierella ambigua]
MVNVREASHAGSWYSSSRDKLDTQLTTWLEKAGRETKDGDALPIRNLRAIIAPKRVFLLGPSHHVYLPGCALSKCDEYETPLGNLIIDKETTKKLHATGQFSEMSFETDEREHSLEMHLPYLYKCFEPNTTIPAPSKTLRIDPPQVLLVPILVGALTTAKEAHYGQLLAPYLNDPDNLFVISTDFCHWGTRFDYTYYADHHGHVSHHLHHQYQKAAIKGSSGGAGPSPPQDPPIFSSIESLDHEGMTQIESGSHSAFAEYLHRTKNTICGRHPIGVLMAAIEALEKTEEAAEERKHNKDNNNGGSGGGGDWLEQQQQLQQKHQKYKHHRIRFVHYAQSSQVRTIQDSSVSYASAFCTKDV